MNCAANMIAFHATYVSRNFRCTHRLHQHRYDQSSPQLRNKSQIAKRSVRVPACGADNFQAISSAVFANSPGLLAGAVMNTLVYILGIQVLLRGLTWSGVLSSWFLGTLSYAAFGAGGYAVVCIYFIVGSLVTKVKLEQKEREGIAEARSGRRSLGSVLGSGFAGMICAMMALYTGNISLFRVGFIASFASKLADTSSSEIGKAYGKTTYLVTTFERVPRGTEGAISAEGTIAGVVAAISMVAFALLLNQVTMKEASIIVFAAFIANYAESFLGALVQGTVGWLTNDAVNIMQISLASSIAVAIASTIC